LLATLDELMAPPEPDEILGPANDDTSTHVVAGEVIAIQHGRGVSVPDALGEKAPIVRADPHVGRRMVLRVLQPVIQLRLTSARAVALHGSAVDIDGRGLVVAGWSETGKTEVALGLAEAGGGFVSDKWTIVGLDRSIHPFPITVGIRRWVVHYLPRLNSSLALAAKLQFRAAQAADILTRPVALIGAGRGTAAHGARIVRAGVSLLDRHPVSLTSLASIYPLPGPLPSALTTVVMLKTVPRTSSITVNQVAARNVIERLARTAAYERRPYFWHRQRAAYLIGGRADGGWCEAVRRDEEAMRVAFEDAQILEVRTPFPVDPRRVSDAILGQL
jgi:hypothetical protein